MKTMQIGDFKAQFSKVLEEVKQGEEIIISYGKKKKNVAVIIPYEEYKEKNKIKLGLLKNKVSYKFNTDYEMTEEELVNL